MQVRTGWRHGPEFDSNRVVRVARPQRLSVTAALWLGICLIPSSAKNAFDIRLASPDGGHQGFVSPRIPACWESTDMNNTTRIFIVLNLVLAICFALLNMVQFAL